MPFGIKNHIVGFKIAIDNPVGVEMGERTEELCRVEGSSGLRETSMMGEETAKGAVGEVGHEET